MARDPLRPTSLQHYLGQNHLKELLTVSLQSAQMRNAPLDHVLLNGPPGLGKTTLANIIAKELSWKIQPVLAPGLNPENLSRLLMRAKPNTVFFIDEVHRLRKVTQEVLYPVLEDGQLQSVWNSDIKMDLPPMTIIGATTNLGRLERPFIDRFGLYFQLEYYSLDELAAIVRGSMQKLGITLEPEAEMAVVTRSRGTPRVANTLLKRLRDFAVVAKLKILTAEWAVTILREKLQVDDIGLRPVEYRYLKMLRDSTHAVGVETLATRLQEEIETVEDYLEPYLMRLNLVERRRDGRSLTQKGRSFLTGLETN